MTTRETGTVAPVELVEFVARHEPPPRDTSCSDTHAPC
jgi:hypothetical protein